jgi:hypothetical protein
MKEQTQKQYRAYFEKETTADTEPRIIEAENKEDLLSQLATSLTELGMDKQVVIIALYLPHLTHVTMVDRQPDGSFRSSLLGNLIEL